MIKAIVVFNNHGKPRLLKFYQYYPEENQQQIVRETFQLVSKRDDNVCNFLEGGTLIGGQDYKLIYRHYATLYFVFCVDSSESELGILDLIQVIWELILPLVLITYSWLSCEYWPMVHTVSGSGDGMLIGCQPGISYGQSASRLLITQPQQPESDNK